MFRVSQVNTMYKNVQKRAKNVHLKYLFIKKRVSQVLICQKRAKTCKKRAKTCISNVMDPIQKLWDRFEKKICTMFLGCNICKIDRLLRSLFLFIQLFFLEKIDHNKRYRNSCWFLLYHITMIASGLHNNHCQRCLIIFELLGHLLDNGLNLRIDQYNSIFH